MLRFIDGFDHSSGDSTKHGTKYLSGHAAGLSSSTRNGSGQCANMVNSTLQTRGLPTSGSTCVIGVALKATDSAYFANLPFLQVREGLNGPIHATLRINSASKLEILRGDNSGMSLGTSTWTMMTNRWYYIEFKVVIDSSTGSFDVRVDGASKLSASSQNTRNGGSGTWDRILVSGIHSGSQASFIDDLYVLDGASGDGCTDFLGDSTVIYKANKTDAVSAGSHADFTCSTGSDHGALVNENPPDDDTTYVHSNNVGDRDSYKWNAFNPTGTIRGLQISAYLKQAEAGARQVRTFVKVSGTDYDHGAAFDLPTGYEYRSQMFSTNPATSSPWLNTEVDAATAERGLKIAS